MTHTEHGGHLTQAATCTRQKQQSTAADLESELVEGLRKAGIPSDLIHKFATGGILKDDAACVLPQSEGQESSLQSLFSICLDADPLPIDAERLGEDLALRSAACFLSIWARLLWHPANDLIFHSGPAAFICLPVDAHTQCLLGSTTSMHLQEQ